MTLTEDNRGDDDFFNRHDFHFPFDPKTEDVSEKDTEAEKLQGKNPLAEEEGQEEDDAGAD